MTTRKIAVAMSGGVDSAVAAALLQEKGADVFGIMMRLWSPEGISNRCCSPHDMALARRTASKLGIPFYVLDFQELFKENVVEYFIEAYLKGITPNPCIECNRTIRWHHLLQQAKVFGATHLATGHYAHVLKSNDKYKLLRAKDLQKDQSYVLSIMNQDQLSHAIFPLGKYTKKEVRDIAHKRALPVADRQESQDLCFVGQQDYRSFLIGHTSQPPSPGPILDMYEQPIGEHDGLAFYTIGQRKGLGISHPHPLYVIEKRVQQNALLVGPREALGRIRFRIAKMNWISGSAPSSERALTVRVRYKAPEVPANLTMLNAHTAEVLLDNPLPDITPGQSAVFYSGEECLGGGIIQS